MIGAWVLNLLARELLLPIFLVPVVLVFEGIWLGPVDEVTRCGVCNASFDGCYWIAGWCGKLWIEVRVCTGEDWVHWRNEA